MFRALIYVSAVVVAVYFGSTFSGFAAFVKDYGIAVSALIVAVGWQINHTQACEREVSAARRKQSSERLSIAFAELYSSAARASGSKKADVTCQNDFCEALDKALAAIYLFGNRKTYTSACELKQLLDSHQLDRGVDFGAKANDLLREIASALRDDLGLEKLTTEIDCAACVSSSKPISK